MPTTVVLGAGIIGLSTAHSLVQLAPPDHRIHLVDPAPELFASASGKAAGFIAKDWFAPAIAPLGNLSFDLHRALADRHNGRARWAFSESISYSLDRDHRDDATAVAHHPPASAPSHHPSEPAAGSDRGGGVEPGQPIASVEDVAPTVTGRNGSQGQGGLDWLLQNTSRATVLDTDVEKAHSERSISLADEAGELPIWLRAKPDALQMISDRKSTAQIHPRQLCEFLLEQCLAAGMTLHHPARATKLWVDEDDPGSLTRIRVEYLGPLAKTVDGRARTVDIPCDNLVITAGCWTPQVYTTLFPNASRVPRVAHLAGYSVTFKAKHWPPVPSSKDPQAPTAPTEAGPFRRHASSAHAAVSLGSSPCHAIFTDARGFAPEIFSRAVGDVWLGGLNPPSTPLPALPTEAEVDPAEVARLLAVARALCGEDIELRSQALCFRPVSATGRPIIARMHEADLGDGVKPGGRDGAGGVFVATGHGPWGISLSLGTGRVLSEMVLGRETSADVSALARW
ncbi:nucleotide-binding domain-containing protein [Trametes polyzona]|nr:nucleotide-binding domain-containing protein [Trametes polyzona]